MSEKIIEFISPVEFIANINEKKDCLMNQSTNQDEATADEGNPDGLWYNIDVPKGHGFKQGDRIKITIEKV
jgi:hypothetical protein